MLRPKFSPCPPDSAPTNFPSDSPSQNTWVNPAPISCDDTKSGRAGNQWTYENAPRKKAEIRSQSNDM